MLNKDLLSNAEKEMGANPGAPLCFYFSSWKVRDYALLYFTDLSEYPLLQRRLPKMPPEDVQRHWTWFAGSEGLRQSVVFSETIKNTFELITGRSIHETCVLDYGAGWGRLTRMMLQFVPGTRVHACDADPKSVDLFNSLGFESKSIKIPMIPSDLPFSAKSFDLIWLWSILTHLPESIANAVMHALRVIVKPGGMVLVTIRPSNFWLDNPLVSKDVNSHELIEKHEKIGFAHNPRSSHWGDTSMSVDYIQRTWPQWAVAKVEDDLHHQIKVYLVPR